MFHIVSAVYCIKWMLMKFRGKGKIVKTLKINEGRWDKESKDWDGPYVYSVLFPFIAVIGIKQYQILELEEI